MDEEGGDIFVDGWVNWDERRDGRESFLEWTIRFHRGECTGEIWHALDVPLEDLWFPVIQSIWEPADYVLTVRGHCNL